MRTRTCLICGLRHHMSSEQTDIRPFVSEKGSTYHVTFLYRLSRILLWLAKAAVCITKPIALNLFREGLRLFTEALQGRGH
jgi:hypothetical protein